LQAKADATGDLNDTTTTMNADKKYLADLSATCEMKAGDFESRQQLRADEIVAVEKAIEIISSGAVSGNADKHLPSLLQTSSFAQLRSNLATQAQNRVACSCRRAPRRSTAVCSHRSQHASRMILSLR